MHHQAAPVTPVHVPRQPRMVIASIWKISFGIASEKGAGVAICAEFFLSGPEDENEGAEIKGEREVLFDRVLQKSV